ncbi:TatD family hydrolase [Vibrio rarus]|uniref:TatD family hydrolase n=1 Tax=Vibrio rarus TaxID=413403 RepID=UPI0021C419D7|nr:TatD family hydrolase [Vibrio rarus]
MWFDTHCHLDFDCFQQDWASYIAKFESAGIERCLIPAVGANNWLKVISLAENKGFYAAVGVHPMRVAEKTQQIEQELHSLDVLISANLVNITAIGECGLDSRFKSCLNEQINAFEFQLHLANRYNKPTVIHSVKQHHQILSSIKSLKASHGVIHAFSGNYQQAKAFIDQGFKIGIGGVITWPTAQKTRQAIAKIPVDSIVLETDAPDMRLAGLQDQPNSPHLLPLIFKQLVSLRSETPSILAEQIWQNSLCLFGDKFHLDT